MTMSLGIALVGYGAIGRLHASVIQLLPQLYPTLTYRPHLVAVCAGGAKSQANAHRDYPHLPHYAYAEILALPNVDIVAICTPTATHATQVADALRAGKHIMCEKPLTVDTHASAALVALAAQQQRMLVLNHHFRRIPAIAEAHRMIAHGHLGTPLSAHLRYYRASNVSPDRPVTWRFQGESGGVLVDLGSHLIDLCHYLFMSPIVRVQAYLQTAISQRPDGHGATVAVTSDDVAWLTAQLANGMRVTIEASKMVPGAADDIRIEAYGTHGSLIFDTYNANVLMSGSAPHAAAMHQTQIWNRQMPAAALPSAETATGIFSWHAASWETLLATLAGESRETCDGAAGLAVDRVIAAARASAADDGSWREVER
jgi:predicted dehydrogenase